MAWGNRADIPLPMNHYFEGVCDVKRISVCNKIEVAVSNLSEPTDAANCKKCSDVLRGRDMLKILAEIIRETGQPW